jgi:hypothetical protein
MKRHPCVLLILALAVPGVCQTLTRQNVASILGFENNTQAGVFPLAWTGSRDPTVVTDDQVVHGGKYSVLIQRLGSHTTTFSSVQASIAIDFSGSMVQWCGYVKTENIDTDVAFSLYESTASGALDTSAVQSVGAKTTADWTQYCVTVRHNQQDAQLGFGFRLIGGGKAWFDDFTLNIDGQPVAQAPAIVRTVLDTDHQFDGGSGISIMTLSSGQIANVATLAKVWGFLKYHHPAVTSGQHHWDYELFRILPQVLSASDQSSANAAIFTWLSNLGPVAPCSPCATLDTSDLAFAPNLDWISDQSLLGTALSQTLQTIYQNRSGLPAQFYVSMPITATPVTFDHELAYSLLQLPDAGYQLLALFRYWNMVQYFYPYRNLMAGDPADSPNYWNQVLSDSIPRVTLAQDSLTYTQELIRSIAKINDTHAGPSNMKSALPPVGPCALPVNVRFVEGNPLIVGYSSPTDGPVSGLLPGDIIQQLDGAAVSDLLTQWSPFYADSNQSARLRDIALFITRGSCGPASVTVQRGNQVLTLSSTRLSWGALDNSALYTHTLPGAPFQMLSADVAYLDMSTAKGTDLNSYLQSAALQKG